MEPVLILGIGIVTVAAVYLLLAADLPRMLIGFVLLGTAANLAILVSGRLGAPVPPLVPPGATALASDAANPLPQALILTAIVIGFGLAAFTLTLVVKSYEEFGTVVADDMDEAETEAKPSLPEQKRLVAEQREAA
jgi:multicomponent Na+:H+ antiporter subunit C